MTKQIQDAYIVAATRTPVGKAPRGVFRNTRPDDMLAHVLRSVVAQAPGIDLGRIDDVIIGCAMPEGEQGMNVARIGVLLAGLPDTVAAQTINRFCSSGLQAVALAADRIRLGEADLMLAGGTESMSMVPMMGNKVALSPQVFAKDENVAIAYGMGITAEKVAEEWKVSREDQDAFALASHQKAIAAIQAGEFEAEITPVRSDLAHPDLGGNVDPQCASDRSSIDEGPRPDTSLEGLAKLQAGVPQRPVRRQRHRRQQLADVRRRRRGAAGVRAGDQGLRPDAARALRQLLGRRRAPGSHGHRPDRGDPEGAQAGRPDAGPARLDRAQRSLRRAGAGGDPRLAASTRRRSIRSAARSRSAIRSAPPARSAPRPSCTACAGASRSTAWSRCASAPAWARRASSKRFDAGKRPGYWPGQLFVGRCLFVRRVVERHGEQDQEDREHQHRGEQQDEERAREARARSHRPTRRTQRRRWRSMPPSAGRST